MNAPVCVLPDDMELSSAAARLNSVQYGDRYRAHTAVGLPDKDASFTAYSRSSVMARSLAIGKAASLMHTSFGLAHELRHGCHERVGCAVQGQGRRWAGRYKKDPVTLQGQGLVCLATTEATLLQNGGGTLSI